jgi:hypothetical protein
MAVSQSMPFQPLVHEHSPGCRQVPCLQPARQTGTVQSGPDHSATPLESVAHVQVPGALGQLPVGGAQPVWHEHQTSERSKEEEEKKNQKHVLKNKYIHFRRARGRTLQTARSQAGPDQPSWHWHTPGRMHVPYTHDEHTG